MALPKVVTMDKELNDLKGYIGYNDKDIYGIEVDIPNNKITRLAGAVGKTAGADFDNINAYKRRRCIMTDDRTVLAYYGETGYIETGALDIEIIKNGVTYPIGTHVQVMVEQPKFYYKRVPLVLEPILYNEINTIEITAGATSDGDITITLDEKPFVVAITSADNTPELVATKIRNALFDGWTTSRTVASVVFTCNTTGAKVTATFNGGDTGVTATVEKTQSGISKGFHLRKWRDYISDYPKNGFSIHPNFIRNGVVYEYIYYPAYEGSIFDVSENAYLLADEQIADFNNDKLSSIANAKPASGLSQNLTIVNTRKLANNRGEGWQQLDIVAHYAEVMLMSIEYATFDFQTAIGLGVVNKSSSDANHSELTGQTSFLGNNSGMAVGTNGLVSITYRGRENPWGNIWKWNDGLNIECKGIHEVYWSNYGFVSDIKTEPYKNCGFTLSKSNGYISAIGYSEECDFMYIPSETLGASNKPLNDYFYQNANHIGFLVARLGGNWNYGSHAGACCLRTSSSSGSRNRDVGGGLLCVPKQAV